MILGVISADDKYNPPTTVTINYYTDFAPKDNSSVAMRTGNFICFSTSSMTLSKNILTDEDSTLSYTITYANGATAPSWLSVKLPSQSASGNFEFSGSYSVFENVLYSFKITATDSKDNKGQQYFTFKLKVGAILTYFKWCEIQTETHDLDQTLINVQIDIQGDIFTSVFEALHVQLAIIHVLATTHDKVNMATNCYSLWQFVIFMYWSDECRLNCMKQKLNNYIL